MNGDYKEYSLFCCLNKGLAIQGLVIKNDTKLQHHPAIKQEFNKVYLAAKAFEDKFKLLATKSHQNMEEDINSFIYDICRKIHMMPQGMYEAFVDHCNTFVYEKPYD